jgi:hypothetical protein
MRPRVRGSPVSAGYITITSRVPKYLADGRPSINALASITGIGVPR